MSLAQGASSSPVPSRRTPRLSETPPVTSVHHTLPFLPTSESPQPLLPSGALSQAPDLRVFSTAPLPRLAPPRCPPVPWNYTCFASCRGPSPVPRAKLWPAASCSTAALEGRPRMFKVHPGWPTRIYSRSLVLLVPISGTAIQSLRPEIYSVPRQQNRSHISGLLRCLREPRNPNTNHHHLPQDPELLTQRSRAAREGASFAAQTRPRQAPPWLAMRRERPARVWEALNQQGPPVSSRISHPALDVPPQKPHSSPSA